MCLCLKHILHIWLDKQAPFLANIFYMTSPPCGNVWSGLTPLGLDALFIKIDFEKTYVWVEWPFIIVMLNAFNFGSVFIDVVETHFAKPSTYLSINRCNSKEFGLFHSIKQGWPLSPTLCLLDQLTQAPQAWWYDWKWGQAITFTKYKRILGYKLLCFKLELEGHLKKNWHMTPQQKSLLFLLRRLWKTTMEPNKSLFAWFLTIGGLPMYKRLAYLPKQNLCCPQC